jgi:hypothetical protein
MTTTFDRNFFTQIGLDSGMLTMLGTVIHGFSEPGEYRCTVRSEDQAQATFYVSVDRNCAVAGVEIDLAKLANPAADSDACCADQDGSRFVVHPKGYAVFHVSGGPGGYAVSARKADEDPDVRAYDTRELQDGDIFSGILLRPGTYSVRNTLSDAQAQVTVAYPTTGDAPYQPPPPQEADVRAEIEPRRIELQPMQGLNFHVHAPARIVIELTEPDDGPGSRPGPATG